MTRGHVMRTGSFTPGRAVGRAVRALALAFVCVACVTGCDGGCAGCEEVRDQAKRATEAAKRGAGSARDGAADLVAGMEIPETIATAKNLRRIAAALRAYHDAHGAFPPYAHRTPDGRPLLSWRVLILPHLGDAEGKLFNQFRLAEPWDGPHNRTLLPRMPKVYARPNVYPATRTAATSPATTAAAAPAEPHVTHYRVFTGPGTAFEEGGRVSLADVEDGADRTVLVVEAREAVPWTRPEALTLAPAGASLPPSLPTLGMLRAHFQVAYCNGEVGIHAQSLAAADLAAMLTIAGGEAFNPAPSGSGGGGGFDWD